MQDKEKIMQEMYMQYQMLDQNIKQMQKQLEMVTGQLYELTVTLSSLDGVQKIDLKKEVLIPLSAGIFAKGSLKTNSELLVNVGANVVVKKDIPSTRNLIQRQIEDVKKIQEQTIAEIENLAKHASQVEMQLHKMASE